MHRRGLGVSRRLEGRSLRLLPHRVRQGLREQQDSRHEQKHELDLKLHQMVCDKTITLKAAQDAIKKDWVKAYNQYVKGVK